MVDIIAKFNLTITVNQNKSFLDNEDFWVLSNCHAFINYFWNKTLIDDNFLSGALLNSGLALILYPDKGSI